MAKKVDTREARRRRRLRIRKKVKGTESIPRLSVHRSLNNISGQLIDDVNGKTILSVSTCDKDLADKVSNGGNVDAAKVVGKSIAEKAKQAKIKQVVFDRGGYTFHGRVKALAEAARENGLTI